MADITIVNGVYKPTYNWGAPSCIHGISMAYPWYFHGILHALLSTRRSLRRQDLVRSLLKVNPAERPTIDQAQRRFLGSRNIDIPAGDVKDSDFPMKNCDFPMKNGDFPMRNGDFPTRNCDFPLRNGDFPMKNGDFPMNKCDFPMKNGDFPMKNGDFPMRNGFSYEKLLFCHKNCDFPMKNGDFPMKNSNL